MPLVSIGLPVYNGENFISQALDSILAQDFADFEVIISDNASTDRTQEICKKYCERDNRIKYYRFDQNYGAARNYNRVFELSSGKYFKWAAHDDSIRAKFISACLAAFGEYKSGAPVVIYPQAVFMNESGNITQKDNEDMQARSRYAAVRVFQLFKDMSMATAIWGLFDRASLEKTRLIGSFISSDYVLLLECALLGKIVHLKGEPLFQRRVHSDVSRSANTSKKDLLRWFDPAAQSKLTETQRLYLEYMISVFNNDRLSYVTKCLCACSVAVGLVTRRIKVVGGRWKRLILRGNRGANVETTS